MRLQPTLIYFTHLLAWTTVLARASPQALPDSDVVVLNRRATICNGHAELCDRGFGNVTFIGAHNSYAIGTNGSLINIHFLSFGLTIHPSFFQPGPIRSAFLNLIAEVEVDRRFISLAAVE